MADQVTIATAQTIERPSDLGSGPDATVRFWNGQLGLAEAQDRDWIERGRKIVERYRDERNQVNAGREVRYNVLWANTETLKPVLYGRIPKPDVSRRHKDEADPSASLGADIIERCLEWEDDIEEFDAVMQAVVEDRLLPGRGIARVFYEPEFGAEEEDAAAEGDTAESGGGGNEPGAAAEGDQDDDSEVGGTAPGGAGAAEAFGAGVSAPEAGASPGFRPVINERAPLRYVFWEDYRESPARTEDEIWWKAYRSYLTRDQLTERFGRELGNAVDLDYTPSGVNTDGNNGPLPDAFKKASVWEIWNKRKREVVWLAKGYAKTPLDQKPDPLELPGFFPSPPALLATTTNNTRVPVADYIEYQDQAQELDNLTSRIDRLVRALKVAGVYAGAEKAVLQQLIDDGSENRLIPVEDWAAFAGDKGGVANLIQWLPVQQIADVVVRLYDARERILAIIYQTTGIADILRGETNPTETLGAQVLKSQFATRRISRAQKEVARFARDLMRLRGSIIARHFSPETLGRMSGLPDPLPALPPPPPMLIPAPQSPMPQPMGTGPAPVAAAQAGAPGVPPGGGAPAIPPAGPPAAPAPMRPALPPPAAGAAAGA
ncbi:MAG TPA: hypothetical protein VGF07_01955 [Stellaceae bacterium]|jgi:hypothetical protein